MTRGDAKGYRLERRVVDFVVRESVLKAGERALLLLSGGADSMALLALLPIVAGRLGLGLEFAALHVDYATRGAQSDRDRAIVERACEAAGVPLHVVRLRRKLTGGDFQARARDLRYGRARDLAAAEGYGVVITAHNRDDQAETVLYRLAKYASPRGLAGMRPRERQLARPLLCLGAAEIREYCRARGIEYGVDATNAEPVYARNAIRLEVLPRLAAINPRVVETLAAASTMAAAEADVLALATAAASLRVAAPSRAGDLAVVDLTALREEPPALRALVLHGLVRAVLGGEALVERRTVDALLALAERHDDSGRVSLGHGLEARRCRGHGLVERDGDIGAECLLHRNRQLGREAVVRAIEVALERDAVIVDLAQLTQRHDLEAAGVGQDRPVPGHELVKAAEGGYARVAGAQIEVVGVRQDDRRPDGAQVVRIQSLDRRVGPDRHELRGFDHAVREGQPAQPGARGAVGRRRSHYLEVRGRHGSGVGALGFGGHQRAGVSVPAAGPSQRAG